MKPRAERFTNEMMRWPPSQRADVSYFLCNKGNRRRLHAGKISPCERNLGRVQKPMETGDASSVSGFSWVSRNSLVILREKKTEP